TGGSYAFVQKYIHDMTAWQNLSVEEQEKVIGRHKFNDIELTDEQKIPSSHNVVTNIKDEKGEDLKIVRANMPFSSPSKNEYGTYFIGYARYFTTTRRMLESMFLGTENGATDELLKYSTAVTGTLFFVPSPSLLDDIE
ncbi:Dyp-type peroxidase, partial [Escherichia coli]